LESSWKGGEKGEGLRGQENRICFEKKKKTVKERKTFYLVSRRKETFFDKKEMNSGRRGQET